jgi:SAM-dependent methyltransferase
VHHAAPENFDAKFYRRGHADVRHLAADQLEQHFRDIGVGEGRQGSPFGTRAEFFRLLKAYQSVLEIGPFYNPSVAGANVKYFDVLSSPALRERAQSIGVDPRSCPEIDYVSATGDLSIVEETFDALVSSHSIEHQPDIILHLQDVARIMSAQGRYFMAIPDKRFCFDHHLAESTIADVLDAHVNRRSRHTLASIIEHRALTTHNDAARHWAGDHGPDGGPCIAKNVRAAVNEFLFDRQAYVDVHAWQFTPQSFVSILECLIELRLIPLRLVRVFHTVRGSNEFFVILEKTEIEIQSLREAVPDDFDDASYFLANPDVQRAGIAAKLHYLTFGRREGRKLRP